MSAFLFLAAAALLYGAASGKQVKKPAVSLAVSHWEGQAAWAALEAEGAVWHKKYL